MSPLNQAVILSVGQATVNALQKNGQDTNQQAGPSNGGAPGTAPAGEGNAGGNPGGAPPVSQSDSPQSPPGGEPGAVPPQTNLPVGSAGLPGGGREPSSDPNLKTVLNDPDAITGENGRESAGPSLELGRGHNATDESLAEAMESREASGENGFTPASLPETEALFSPLPTSTVISSKNGGTVNSLSSLDTGGVAAEPSAVPTPAQNVPSSGGNVLSSLGGLTLESERKTDLLAQEISGKENRIKPEAESASVEEIPSASRLPLSKKVMSASLFGSKFPVGVFNEAVVAVGKLFSALSDSTSFSGRTAHDGEERFKSPSFMGLLSPFFADKLRRGHGKNFGTLSPREWVILGGMVFFLLMVGLLLGLSFKLRFRWLLAFLRRHRDKALLFVVMAVHGPFDARADSVLAAVTKFSGNGEGYGGGDLLERRLVEAREELKRVLEILRTGHRADALCEAKLCAAGDGVCAPLVTLTSDERRSCRESIAKLTPGILARLASADIRLATSAVPLLIPDASGKPRAVAAMTELSESGPVIFHQGTIAKLSQASLLALLAHEIGHKVRLGNAFIDDRKSVARWSSGSRLLDVLGAAIAVYSSQIRVPRQAAPELPVAVPLGSACAQWARGKSTRALGWYADLLRTIPGEAAASDPLRLLASPAARIIVIKRWFERYLSREPSPKEIDLLLGRLADGMPYEGVMASIIGDKEYLAVHGNLTPAQFLVASYQEVVGRPPTGEELASDLERLASLDRPTVVLHLFHEREGAMARLIHSWFEEYLNRPPTPEESLLYVNRLRGGAGWEATKSLLLREEEYAMLQTLRFQRCLSR